MSLCLIVQPIHPHGIALLHEAGIETRRASSEDMQVVAQEIEDCDAVLTRNAGLDGTAMLAAPRLRVIAGHGAGTNRIDRLQATALGVPVVNTPSANARSVAEHAIALMLAVSKRLLPSDQAVRKGNWAYRYQPGLRELHGKTLGVVGLGAIGRHTAQMAAHGFGMRVIGHSPSVDRAVFEQAGIERCETVDDLLEASDYVTLHRPLRDDTRHLINRRALTRMKPDAVVINTARGELIDTQALVEALLANRLGGAGLDVFEDEPLAAEASLAALEQVVLSPHTGGSTDEALKAMAEQCAQQIIDVLAGRRPPHLINPEVWERRRLP